MVRQRGVCCGLPEVDEQWAEKTSALMKALADPTRLTMIASLWKAKAPICICDFAAGLELTQPTLSHHMAKLKDAGVELIDSEPRVGIRDSRVAFLHPRSTGGVLTEIVEPAKEH